MQNSISRCVFEFGDIRHSSCIGYACIEITVQQVFKNVLWILCVTSAAIGLVFDHGLNTWIPEIRNESFDRVSPIIYFQEQPTAV